MADDDKLDPSDKETTLVPELEEATEGGLNEKRFATNEKTVHLQFDSPLPPTQMPQAPAPVATPAIDRGLEPPVASVARSGKMAEFGGAVRDMPLAPPMERKPFWPVALVVGLCLGGFQYYKTLSKNPAAPVAEVAPAANEPGNRAPASLTVAPAPDPLMNKDMSDPAANKFTVPIPTEVIDESTAVYVLKSESDDFNVLVNGKDMPVISGKITLPLKQKLDLRFVRRGYKEIQMTTMAEKGGKQELVLKFEKLAVPPEPKRLYQ